MKPLSISVVSAAILAAASFGAQAQQTLEKQEQAPSVKQSAPSDTSQKGQQVKPEQGQGGHQAQSDEKPKPGERAQREEKSGQQDQKSGDMKQEKPAGGMNKDTARDQKPDTDRKSADQQKQDHDRAADQQQKQDRDKADQQNNNQKAADQNQGGKPQKEAGKEIKPEQKTIIKETIVREKIKPERINVEVRVGVAIPRTVVLHPLFPTIIEVYPSYSRYKLVLLDDNTILIIDPDTWTVVDVIEV
jgi:hypothetical protein